MTEEETTEEVAEKPKSKTRRKKSKATEAPANWWDNISRRRKGKFRAEK